MISESIRARIKAVVAGDVRYVSWPPQVTFSAHAKNVENIRLNKNMLYF